MSCKYLNCSCLTSVTINNNALLTDDTIWGLSSIFGNQVTEYILGKEITRIGHFAFIGCSGLTSIIIPKGVTIIDDGAFSGCI